MCALASTAFAQLNASESASAEALFEAGKGLMAEGKMAAACPKFEESLKLDNAIGTRFQLARCYESLGRTASAWSLYLDVAAKARTLGQTEREAYARSEAARLRPTLSNLTISVAPEQRVNGLEVTRNGAPVGSGQWDVALPVDPGHHQLTANAPGKKPWAGSIDVKGNAERNTFKLPPLQDAPPVEAFDENEGAAKGGLRPLQWAGIGTAGAGVVALGVAGFFALRAKNKDAESGCDGGACKNDTALSINSQARSAGDVATVATLAGGVLIAVGATLVLIPAPKSKPGESNPALTARVMPSIGQRFAGVALGGGF